MKPNPKSQSTPEFSEAQYRYLVRVFGSTEITPDNTLSEVMFDAGRRDVIKHIKGKVEVWTGPS